MSKELNAKEFLKNKGYGSGTNYTTGAVAVLMEQYATARLEAYKAELEEVVKSKMMLEPKLFVEIGRHQAFEFILSHLTKKESDGSK